MMANIRTFILTTVSLIFIAGPAMSAEQLVNLQFSATPGCQGKKVGSMYQYSGSNKPRGLAIDGKIEGRYSEGNTVYKKP